MELKDTNFNSEIALASIVNHVDHKGFFGIVLVTSLHSTSATMEGWSLIKLTWTCHFFPKNSIDVDIFSFENWENWIQKRYQYISQRRCHNFQQNKKPNDFTPLMKSLIKAFLVNKNIIYEKKKKLFFQVL